MESLTSSRRSSSSCRSSARYSTSSCFRSESSLTGSCDTLDALLQPFLDSPESSSLFWEEGKDPFGRHSRCSYGHSTPVGSAVPGGQSSAGGGSVQCVGDSYHVSADVSQFEPHDVVVMAYNHHVVIHAEKVMDDGSISDTFTQKSLCPKDMNPLSVRGTIDHDGILVVSVHRSNTAEDQEPLAVLTKETHL
ncbi:heat shock protein beta-7-like [Dunckerocampus dactyliophorus]|uniref:heat shock protein beta-7-like n=1 Tax=Dunckerocampus dactyliophorus TaxID=161453 RepID=UPI002405B17E|nr:heat shock protein beta-7-like [Dunckerocampus dactyliophorus]